jgi:natural product biosynthesis luciferase-like monooxygenase protein
MNQLQERLAKLSPEQQQLLLARLNHKRSRTAGNQALPDATPTPDRYDHDAVTMDFSLLFFSGDGSQNSADKYGFLLECVRFADEHDFRAVWTPERHFQTFGGLFPNPSVLSAALAMITQQIQIRAGSVVVPMHHPVRLAEEWALVDNLSNGRVGISLASGWSRADFTLAPDNYAARREIAFRNLDLIQRLWAGETVELPGVDQTPFPVSVLPRPIQRRLPIWITASSAQSDSWEKAGELGANVFTAMLGTPDDLRPCIQRYRDARDAHGHAPEQGLVTVMMHTFIGEDEQEVKTQVQAPLCRYLEKFIAQDDVLEQGRSGVSKADLSERDRQDMTLLAFERYFQNSGLLGTPDKCADMVAWMHDAGVGEIACLVDFGADRDGIRAGLDHLGRLNARYRRVAQDRENTEVRTS